MNFKTMAPSARRLAAHAGSEEPIRLHELRDSAGRLLAIIGPTTFYDALATSALLRPNGKMVDLRRC